MKTIGFTSILILLTLVISCADAIGAEELKLRPGISFTQDIDTGFPIIGAKLDDVAIEDGKPALIFFGACGDLNTHRQAKRLVDLYNSPAAEGVKFIVIDVDKPGSTDARKLIKTYYKGYIPCETVIDKTGQMKWTQTGEVDTAQLKKQLDRVSDD